LVEGRAGVRVV